MADVIELGDSDESMGNVPMSQDGEGYSEDASDDGSGGSEEEDVSEEDSEDAAASLEEDDDYDMKHDGQEAYASMFGYLRVGDTYHPDGVQAVVHNRRRLGNELFFDKLTQQLKIKDARKLYPPRDDEDLRNLYTSICSSSLAEHYKQSLLFYILLDRQSDDLGESDAPELYAARAGMPENYEIMMRGLWCMDRLRFEEALEYITYPSLTPTFSQEILYILLTQTRGKDMSLALAYYYSTSPTLTDPKVLHAFYVALAHASTAQAYGFLKSFPSTIHKHLFELLVGTTLSLPASDYRSEAATQLINLPLSEEEEEWFNEYLSKGEGQKLQGAKETLMMRQLGRSKFEASINGNKKLTGRRKDGVNWQDLRQGLESGLGSRHYASAFSALAQE